MSDLPNIDKSDTKQLLPESLITKLFDATGVKTGGGRGFIMYFINEDGAVSSVEKYEHPFVKHAISQVIEKSVLFQPNDPFS